MPKDWYTPRSLFNFSWRASRREYFALHLLGFAAMLLPVFVTGFFAGFFAGASGGAQSATTVLVLIFGLLQFAFLIGGFVVSLAVSVRRMHDQEKSGWLLLLGLIPLVGWIFSLIFIFTPGDEQENLYGPNPRYEGRPGSERAPDLARVFE